MNRGAGWPTVHRVTQSRTRLKQFSTHALHRTIILGESDSINSSAVSLPCVWSQGPAASGLEFSFQGEEREVLGEGTI